MLFQRFKYLIHVLMILSCIFSYTAVRAETVQIDLDGAKKSVFFDLETGLLYIEGDCQALLQFRESPSSKNKQDQSRTFTIKQINSRSKSQTKAQDRHPQSIIIKGNEVSILSSGLRGMNSSRGRIVSLMNINSKSRNSCRGG